ncbi:MAG: ABC transporter permease [Planctomycetes bacterium]|nr:ABC transporter permease [Planctomycetota bacterium]
MKRILGVLGLVIALYVVLFNTHANAGKSDNLIDVANLQGRYGLITLGVALVIITGGIDLSIGSVVGCGAILFGTLMVDGVHPYAAVPLVILFGLAVGVVNGLLVTRLKLQPFLVTLCGMFVIRGIARLIGGTVSRDRVLTAHPEFRGALDSLRYVLIGKDSTGELQFPAMFALMLLAVAAVGFFLHRTAYGRYWYAIGHNELAAKYAGVNVNRHRLVVYVACSALAALVGVLLFLNEATVQSDNAGVTWELYAILGAVLGGCSLRGGEGTVVGMALGAMVLPIIENVVNFSGKRSDVIPLIVGLTLLLGTMIDELIRRRSRVHR